MEINHPSKKDGVERNSETPVVLGRANHGLFPWIWDKHHGLFCSSLDSQVPPGHVDWHGNQHPDDQAVPWLPWHHPLGDGFCLVLTGTTEFWMTFPIILGIMMIPIDELRFYKMVKIFKTTNQLVISVISVISPLPNLQGGAPVRERSVGANDSKFTMVFVGDISN